MSADDLFGVFHGTAPRADLDLDLEWPEAPHAFGRALRVVYRSDKRNGGGDGTEIDYVHPFGDGVEVVGDVPARVRRQFAERGELAQPPEDLAWLGGVVELAVEADGRRLNLGPVEDVERDARDLPPLYAYRLPDGRPVLVYLTEHFRDAPVLLVAGGALEIEARGLVD